MSIEEERAPARPGAGGAEVIGDASGVAASAGGGGDSGPKAPPPGGSFERPTEPQPVSWPPATEVTRPMPSTSPVAGVRPPAGPVAPPNGQYGHIWQDEAESQNGRHTQNLQPVNEAAPHADPWGQPTGDPWVDVTPGTPKLETVGAASDSRRRRIGGAVGLVAAGAVVGALVGGAYTQWRSNDNAALASQAGQVPGPGGQPGGQLPGQSGQGQPGPGSNGQSGQNGQGFGGQGLGGRNDGEVRLVGTLTAVKGAKVTVRSAAGSASYTIASSTRIVRNGTAAKASDLHVGDVVLVHAFPQSNADSVLELIYARGTASANPSTGSSSSSEDDSTT